MIAVKKILVPTDFSAPANNALHYALMFARQTNAEIHLLHSYSVPVVDPYMPGETINSMMEEIKLSSEKSMMHLVEDYPGEVLHTHIEMGFAVDEINDFAMENDIDLIIMGTSGSSGLEGALFGSNTSGVIGKSKKMVIAVPHDYNGLLKPTNIVYAADFSGDEEMTFRHVAGLAEAFGCHLHLFHIKGAEPNLLGKPTEAVYLDMLATIPYKNISFSEKEDADVVHGIKEYIHTHSCDLLVMAKHQRTLFERFFHRSKTKAVANHTEVPLLVLKKND